MKYVDEFRDADIVSKLEKKININNVGKKINLMEVCGGHTHAIYKYGLQEILPDEINLLSGPGCPVCVTPQEYIDKAIVLAQKEDLIITSFGDMLKVPGSRSSLKKEKSRGHSIKICYSPDEAIRTAVENRKKEIVFLGIGFETTAPSIAQTIKKAREEKINNFSVLPASKTMPEAMEALLQSEEVAIDGFICPGHVSTITGSTIYNFIPEEYNIPCVISGFEPVDILESINKLIKQINKEESKVENQYIRSVKIKGNKKAKAIMYTVFTKSDSKWRGLGTIPESGLQISEEFKEYNAENRFDISVPKPDKSDECICGAIMRGVQSPQDCSLFKTSCTPKSPVGPCMVSSEGPCAAFYKYQVS